MGSRNVTPFHTLTEDMQWESCQCERRTYFVGKDVAVSLGYAKPENAISAHVDQEDKTTTLIQGDGSNYKSKTTLINESGLYSLILSSKLPKAKSSSVNEEHKSFLYLFLLYSYLHLLLYLLLCLDFVDMSMTCHWQTAKLVFLREISVVQVCQKNVLIFAVFVARGLFFIYFFYILIYIFFYIFFCRVILRDACVTLTFSSAIAFCRCL